MRMEHWKRHLSQLQLKLIPFSPGLSGFEKKYHDVPKNFFGAPKCPDF